MNHSSNSKRPRWGRKTLAAAGVGLAVLVLGAGVALAAIPGLAATGAASRLDSGKIAGDQCSQLPGYSQLKKALAGARAAANGGFTLEMWGTIVDRDGEVCAVAFTGGNRDDQWPGSRVISAQKANTANAFSLPGLALSTANLYAAVQPGGSLFGLQHSNPVDVSVAYKWPSSNFGQANDPMVGSKIGGVNVFGGGLALYDAQGHLLGGIGVSGDTSCADHNIAWRTRHSLGLDHVPGGVSGDPARPDNIAFDMTGGVSGGGFGHVHCRVGQAANESAIAAALPPTS